MSDDVGFPQLDTSSYPSQLFWVTISFIMLYFLMSKFALPRVEEAIETRRKKKNGDLDKASEIKEEAEKIKDAYQKSLAEAHKVAAKSLFDMEQEISEKISAAQARFSDQSRDRVLKAEEDIDKAKKAALNSVKDISAEIAADMVYKIAKLEVSNDIAKKAIEYTAKKV